MSNSPAIGQHVLLDLYNCHEDLRDSKFVEEALIEAANKAGATIVSHHFHKFSPCGVSGVVIIQESHLTIHTWPEHNFASVDIYTCGEEMNFESAVNYLKHKFASDKIVLKHFERGNHLISSKTKLASSVNAFFKN
tara:strand:- start:254 stop:661 length:408 start_codon:yes stop_codon:yes gene_type:complete